MGPADQIAEILTAVEQAWNDGDAPAYARRFAADAVYVTRGAVVWEGRPAIEEAHAKAFAGSLAGTLLTLRPLHVNFPSETVAVAQVDVQLASDEGVTRAVTTFVLSFDGAAWTIVAAHSSEVTSVH